MSGYLELADGAFIGVRDGLVLGRVVGCDVVVDDTKASRRHARLIVEAGVVEIEDMNSSNGTLLNGKPVDRRMMRDGDEVRIGKTVIIYRSGTLPGAKASRSAPSSASMFDDDDDLLGGASAAATVAAPRASEAGTPPAASHRGNDLSSNDLSSDDLLGDDLLGDDLLGEPPSPVSPPMPQRPAAPPKKPAPTNVVEFEDEVVEVKQGPPPKRHDPEPVIEVRKPQRTEAAGAKAAPGGAGDVVGSSQRVLQFSKQAGGKNPLGDDLGQMSSGMRLLVVIAAVAIGGGIIYGITFAMQ